MKNVYLFATVLTLSISAQAANYKLDCSKAAGGEVTLTSTQKRFTAKEAASKAYKCFVDQKAASVQNARIQAIQESQASAPGESCGESDPVLELSSLSSWVSGRPDVTEVNGVLTGIMGGNYVLSIRENFTCSSVGTGLYEGITASTVTDVNVDESYRIEMETEKAKQEITVRLIVK